MTWADDFLYRYYHDDILSLAGKWPEQQSLYIDTKFLSIFKLDRTDLLFKYPDEVITELEKALKDFELPFDIDENWNPNIRITGSCYGSDTVAIRDIRNIHVGRLINVTGVVQKISQVWPRIVTASFECQRCMFITKIHQTGFKFIEPIECENEMCGRKGPFKLCLDKSVMVDTQKLQMQEPLEDLDGSHHAQTIDVQLDKDLVGQIAPGNKISIIGILRASHRTTKANIKTPYLDMVLESNSIKLDETELDLNISDDEMTRIHKLAENPDIVDWLVAHFATAIFGYDSIKEALLAAAVSGDNIIKPDGTIQRGFSHVIICGDPATAKSTLLDNIKQLIPRSVLSTGDGSSSAGLTAAVVKDNFHGSKYTLEAGSLVLADGSVAIIDELDKLHKNDVKNLNSVLYSSSITINKADIHCTMKARCPVLCAMNPKHGRFDRFEVITKQINIKPDTLSRFDLIFMMFDIPNPDDDLKKTKTLLGSWGDINNDNIDLMDIIRKYISVARRIKHVTVTTQAIELIRSYYLDLRNRYDPQEDVISITLRHLEALMRLTMSEAKLRLSDTANATDAQRAINLLTESLRETSIDKHGRQDASIIEVGSSKSQRDIAQHIRETIFSLQADGPVHAADIILKLSEHDISQKEFESTIKHMLQEGSIYQPKDEEYKCI